MVDLRRRFGDFMESGAFRSLFNICEAVDDHTFLTKSGELIAAISFRGIDAECCGSDQIDAISAVCVSAAKVFDERFLLNSFLLKRSAPALDSVRHANPVVDEAIRNRLAYLSAKGQNLYSYEAFLTVLIRPEWGSPRLLDRIASFGRNPLETLRRALRSDSQIKRLDDEVARALRTLHQATKSFLDQTADHLDARVLGKNEAFSFFRRLLNPDPIKADAIHLTHDVHVDYFAVDSELECYRDRLHLDNYVYKVLTLKQLPSRTFSNMLADLAKVRADLIFTTEWSVMETARALADIRSRRRHAHNTKVGIWSQIGSERPYDRELLYDESKEALVGDLGECLKALEMRGLQLGRFSLTVLVIAASLEEAERGTAEVMKVVGVHDGVLNEERYNGLNAFLASLPGGHPYNLRKNLVTNENHGDMVSWFQPAEGERRNEFLGAPYLAAFETEDLSLYFFNLHVQDVGHTLFLGSTGSGKSFALNFLLTHAQQYNPYTFIFDVGRSYQSLTELFGGAFVPFRPELRPFSINPFCLEPTDANLEFLFAFCKLLIESDGHRMTDSEERELFDAIRSLYVLDRDQRRLLTLSTTVARGIGNRLKRWTEGEQYGSWFDNVEDTVTLSRFQTIDFEGMERLGIVREPLLFYILHRVSEVIYDPSLATVPKFIVFDEAWLFCRHPVTQAYIADGARTWRKKNTSLILCTQSLQDLASAQAFRTLIDNCPTKLLLANSNLDASFYADVLRLNAVEIEKVRGLVPKRQLLLKRDKLSKVLNLNVDRKSYWLFTTNPYEAKRRQDLINQGDLSTALDTLTGGSL